MRRDIEERSLNAWPALETLIYDGWLLRFANGHTKLANSVIPLYDANLPVTQKIDMVERLYRQRGLASIFKLTPWMQPTDLDARLADRGYRVVDPTSIRVSDLRRLAVSSDTTIRIAPRVDQSWMEGVAHLAALDGRSHATLAMMMARVPAGAAFAGYWQDGRMLAAGLGVLEERAVGLFEIVTDAAHRRQGLARRICRSIMAWAKAKGAAEAYLQVVASNAGAIALYDPLGFREAYRYHYRVRD